MRGDVARCVGQRLEEHHEAAVGGERHVAGPVLVVQPRALQVHGPQDAQLRREHQHAVVLRVGHDDAPVVVRHDTRRPVQLADAGALAPHALHHLRQRAVHHQQPMVLEVGYDNIPTRGVAHAARCRRPLQHFGGVRTLEHELGDIAAVAREHLDAVVARVRHHDVADRVHGHVPRVLELAAFFPERAEFKNEVSGRREYLNSVIVLIDYDDAPVSVGGDARGEVEFPGASSFRAKHHLEFAATVEYLYSVVSSVGDYDVSFSVDAEAPRPRHLALLLPLPAEGEHGHAGHGTARRTHGHRHPVSGDGLSDAARRVRLHAHAGRNAMLVVVSGARVTGGVVGQRAQRCSTSTATRRHAVVERREALRRLDGLHGHDGLPRLQRAAAATEAVHTRRRRLHVALPFQLVYQVVVRRNEHYPLLRYVHALEHARKVVH